MVGSWKFEKTEEDHNLRFNLALAFLKENTTIHVKFNGGKNRFLTHVG